MQEPLYQRKITSEVIRYLDTDVILVLLGPRQAGKTHVLYLLQNHLKERGDVSYYLDLEDSRLVEILDKGVDVFLSHLAEQGYNLKELSKRNKKLYVFIDEIQYLAKPSPFLKLVHDHHPQIKLIVSGSSSFEIRNKFTNSLVGRTLQWDVLPLSFSEFLIFKGQSGDPALAKTEMRIEELKLLYAEYALYGGYPKIALTPDRETKEKYLQQIFDTYIKKDIRDLAGIKDVSKFNRLVQVVASQSGMLLNVDELSRTVGISKITVSRYLFMLEQTYVLKLVAPFSNNLRSELFKRPKIFFYDSGLLQLLWLKSIPREITGSVLETSIFGELVKKYSKDAVHYWRTADKKEIDFILDIRKKALLPIEVKKHFGQFDATAIDYFLKKYKLADYRVVGLNGAKSKEKYVYPWEL